MYTNIHYLCIFLIFQIFFLFLYEKQNNKKKNWKVTKQKHVKQDKSMHKTRLTQNMKAKHISNAIKKKEKEKWLNNLEPFSFHTLEKPFRLANPWTDGEGEELKPFKFERNMRALRRSPKGVKEDGN